MAYVKRLTAPPANSKYYLSTSYGGYNPCIIRINHKVLPNFVGYAWGRFMEIMGPTVKPKLSTGNAGTWYGHTSDGYARGRTPKVGSVICWSKYNGPGHVAIVEEVKSNGDVVVSASNYSGPTFYTSTYRAASNYSIGSAYTFQGFIYNPNTTFSVDKLSQFIDIATKQVGKDGTWTWSTSGLTKNQPWCAAFIIACAKTVGGLLNYVIPNTFSASEIGRTGVKNKYGTFLLGPAQNKNSIPQPGDLVLFRTGVAQSYVSADMYTADRIGIVKQVINNTVQTIEGDYGGKVVTRSYSYQAKTISGYYRPDWAIVGASLLNSEGASIPLYTSVSTREDATVREMCYINSNSEPSINTSNIKLSVINYTTGLNAIYTALGGGVSNDPVYDVTADTSGMKAAPREIANYLMKKGLNAAASVGIIGNIEAESDFRTNCLGDYVKGSPTSFGICQWHYGRGDAMKRMAGSNWANNLTGQLDYLWYELTTSYKNSVLTPLKGVPNSESGAKQAADIFVRKFEIPANVSAQSVKRQNNAVKYWRQLAVKL